MNAEIWEVEVLKGGATPVDLTGPVKFGTTAIILGEGPTEPVVYAPVMVRTVGKWMGIQSVDRRTEAEIEAHIEEHGWATTGWVTHREMQMVSSIEFDEWGTIRVEGFEAREDGTAVWTIWSIQPYQQRGDRDQEENP